MKNYISSTINQEIQKRMLDKQIAWNDQLSENCIYGLFEAFGVFLGKHKSKDNPVAVILNDFNGGYHFGAFVQFIPQNEESTDEGSWALSYSFDENDIDSKNWKVFTFNDDPEVCKLWFFRYHTKRYAIKKDLKTLGMLLLQIILKLVTFLE